MTPTTRKLQEILDMARMGIIRPEVAAARAFDLGTRNIFMRWDDLPWSSVAPSQPGWYPIQLLTDGTPAAFVVVALEDLGEQGLGLLVPGRAVYIDHVLATAEGRIAWGPMILPLRGAAS